MHIPDGYLSPQTCAAAAGVALPFVVRAYIWVRRHLRRASLGLLGALAAASFLIQMLNIPLPGGTTGHAVGSVLIAIALGVWPAVVAESVVLAVQALLFGDGGVLALGANILNMAVVMPLVGYGIYRAIAGSSASTSRRAIAGAVAGYVALNVAALLAALEFGVQPYFFKDAAGLPLYCPYDLKVAVPAMALGHLTWAGAAEALFTGFGVWFLAKAKLLEGER